MLKIGNCLGLFQVLSPTANSLNCLSGTKPVIEQFAAITPQVFSLGVAYHCNKRKTMVISPLTNTSENIIVQCSFSYILLSI